MQMKYHILPNVIQCDKIHSSFTHTIIKSQLIKDLMLSQMFQRRNSTMPHCLQAKERAQFLKQLKTFLSSSQVRRKYFLRFLESMC